MRDLGYHRLELEIYGFNARALAHAERSGFVREGVRRRAYRRHGDWVDGVLFGVVADELDVPAVIRLLHDYVGAHNEAVRTGEWSGFGEWFTEDAELAFEGVAHGPFRGRETIEEAYRTRPPDDQVLVFETVDEADTVVARYGWLREPSAVAGRMLLTPACDRIAKLIVTFDAG